MIYTDLVESLDRAKERSGATAIDDVYLAELLNISVGIDSMGLKHFRPFYVAAKFIEQNQAVHILKEADSVVFTGLPTPIASLLNFQAAYDASNGLIIPPGMEAIPPVPIVNNPLFSTRVLRTVAVW